MKKPVIAIPIGDPAGVGPEIVAKSIASDEVFQIAVCVIVGDRKILEKAIEITGENLKINEIKEPDEAVDEKGVLNLIDLDNVDMDTFAYGKVSGMCGKAAYDTSLRVSNWQMQARLMQLQRHRSTRNLFMQQKFHISVTQRYSGH